MQDYNEPAGFRKPNCGGGRTDDNLTSVSSVEPWRPTRRAEGHYTKDKLSTRRGAVHSIGWLARPRCAAGVRRQARALTVGGVGEDLAIGRCTGARGARRGVDAAQFLSAVVRVGRARTRGRRVGGDLAVGRHGEDVVARRRVEVGRVGDVAVSVVGLRSRGRAVNGGRVDLLT